MAVPPDFVSGQVLTAAQMNAIGLWEIKSQTIGTGVSSVTVTNAFSADYDNYRIIVSGGVASTGSDLRMTLGSTTSGYFWAILYSVWNNTPLASGTTTGTYMPGIYTSTTVLSGVMDVCNPFAAKNTTFHCNASQSVAGGGSFVTNGFLNNTTSYTDFTLTTGTGTITGGTIRVYGYRN